LTGQDGGAVRVRELDTTEWTLWRDLRIEALVEGALRIAEAARVERVDLHCTDGNDAADRLYRRFGFTATGRTEALRPGSSITTTVMSLQLLRSAEDPGPQT
jgi:hypothetical protein